MAGTQKQDQSDRRPSDSQDKAPGKTPRADDPKGDKRDGIKPREADPNYGPPDPEDPQRSGT
jgi:hypothetical protein